MGAPNAALARHPLLARFVLLVLLPLALAALAAWHHFAGSLPPAGGPVMLDGAQAPIRVTRDAQGVPHIAARTPRDVYFAMGYLHAQDRLWQLEVQRRVASGRLSEVFGAATVKQDVWLRTLGLRAAAGSAWAALTPQAQASLQAYSDGINAWLARHPTLPPEFAMLGVRPEPWTPLDSLAWVKVFALNLSGNLDREIAHFLAAQQLAPAQLALFFGPAPGLPAPVPAPGRAALAAAYDSTRLLQTSLHIGGKNVGSNAWAISGRLTANGAAILANDPHLGLQMPSLWYPVQQQGGALQASGMSLVGLPLVVFGRNQHIAWGGTALPADVQDLYFEQVDPRHPQQYRAGDRWLPFEQRAERIGVRAAFPAALREPLAPRLLTVRSSRHGPLVSDAMEGALNQPVALRWTALDPGDTTYESFFRLSYAQDWTQFRAALRAHVAPTMNMLYADRGGNIGYAAVGRIPLRGSGDGASPSAGDDDGANWRGYVPFERMPLVYNPPGGYIVSANDGLLTAGSPYFISRDWADPGRAQRIAALLARQHAAGPMSSAASAAMQQDVVSLPAARLAARLAALAPAGPRQRQALAMLHGWRGEMAADSGAAALFQVWVRHLRQQLFSTRLHAEGANGNYLDALVDELPLDAIGAVLADDCRAWAEGGCGPVLHGALDGALDELTKLAGTDMADWQWGRIHTVRYDHMPFSQVRLLDEVFGRRLASGGSSDTINVANAVYTEAEGYRQTFGAGFRQVMEMGPAYTRHLYMDSTGASGNLLSSHFADMVAPFRQGRMYALAEPGGADPILTILPPTTSKRKHAP